ncbi:MAG: hypothetical protein M3536_13145 [Actinomycetota bacterium]|nr:hypothetical protein [Actinomycetota bacterium]
MAEIKSRMQRLEAANVFGLTGIKPKAGGTDLDGFVNVNGPMVVNGNETVNGPITINGAATITGTLSLPAGIIGNDALTNPIFTSAGYGDANGFEAPNSETTVASATIAIPAGYTKATVTGIGAIYLYNSDAAPDFGYGRVYIDWPSGPSNFGAKIPFALGGSGGSGNSSPNRLVEKTGLSGGSITVRLVADSDNGVPAHAANQATINALIIFTR